ncbi:putative helicase MOV-10 [Rhopilema esculentum]|uniref:putative helicase MOV-10 n=1 Tax=Rhopilema esculentum TaxID=499914 RepID=UPI0031DA5EE7|eukprot:gene2198-17792_t
MAMRAFLPRDEAVRTLRSAWDEEKYCDPASFQLFIENFFQRISTRFCVNDSLSYYQELFCVSRDLVCMFQEILEGKVVFRAKVDLDFELVETRVFNKVCNEFFCRFARTRSWHSIKTLEEMFAALKRKDEYTYQGVALKDVIVKLIKHGVLEMRYKKEEKKMPGFNPNLLYGKFTAHLKDLGDSKPEDRAELLDEFNRMFPHNSEDFTRVVQKMKNKKFLKFTSGHARIIYLKAKKIATNQHFAKAGRSQSTPTPAISSLDIRKMNGIFGSRSQLQRDDGIQITSDHDEGVISNGGVITFSKGAEGQKVVVTMKNATSKNLSDIIYFTGYKLLDNFDGEFTVKDKMNIAEKLTSLCLSPGESYQLSIWYNNKRIGKSKCPLVLNFENDNIPGKFEHCIFLHAETTNPDIDEMRSNDKYQPLGSRQTIYDPAVEIIPGIPPDSGSSSRSTVSLDQFKIPRYIHHAINNQKSKEFSGLKALLKESDSPDSYRKRFHNLLFLEELQMEVDIRRYDMHDVGMKKCSTNVALEVPGLAEGKPSLIIGDKVYARHKSSGSQESANKKEYEGYVHVVERDRVLLKFHASFIPGRLHDVRFSFNRGPIRLQHRAVDIASDMMEENEFPFIEGKWDMQSEPLLPEVAVSNIRVFDRKIESNPQQLTAVKNILWGVSMPYPYIIFGPPGTGKTVTSVEAMRQVLRFIPNSRILACAPSNSAADLIFHRLLNPCPILKKKMFRLNAISRSVDSLPDEYDLKSYCKIENNLFAMPSLEEIDNYRAVVCTMTTAGRIVSMGVGKMFFTHIFLDECGQSVEPEALIPLAGLLSPENEKGGQIVLAGDPRQLGPVLRSPIAIEHGLSLSMLERLMASGPIYQKSAEGSYDSKFITKLIKNYRSHPAILKKPNEYFYDNELIPEADTFKTTTLCKWAELPAKDFPIIFHGVTGEDQREGNSPSFFNPQEAAVVVKYAQSLLEERKLGVTPDEIGIISPYHKQVSKIRKLLEKKIKSPRIDEIKVGSVEEFQGQERRIIIISTVRSNEEYLKTDSAFRLGFLKNPKRFNVAITRAQALLVMIGNPFVLSKDKYWKGVLDYCIANGGYTGCSYSDQIVDSLAQSVADLLNIFA